MKFTSEALSEALKAKMSGNGKNIAATDRTIKTVAGNICKRLEKNGDERELAEVVEDYIADFEAIDGQLRHDQSENIKAYIKKKEAETPQPKAEPAKSGSADDGTTDSSALQALQKQIQELIDKQRANDEAQAVAAKKSAIASKLKEKIGGGDEWIGQQLGLVSVNADTDADALADKLTSLYNLYRAGDERKRTPERASGGSEDNGTEFEAIRKMREAQLKRERDGK